MGMVEVKRLPSLCYLQTSWAEETRNEIATESLRRACVPKNNVITYDILCSKMNTFELRIGSLLFSACLSLIPIPKSSADLLDLLVDICGIRETLGARIRLYLYAETSPAEF